jgi:hypothetical protein
LVLNLVSSTLSCIRQPRPRLDKGEKEESDKGEEEESEAGAAVKVE